MRQLTALVGLSMLWLLCSPTRAEETALRTEAPLPEVISDLEHYIPPSGTATAGTGSTSRPPRSELQSGFPGAAHNDSTRGASWASHQGDKVPVAKENIDK